MNLEIFFKEQPQVAIAFSGGVDSAFLLSAAVKNALRVTAYYVQTSFQSKSANETAERIAAECGAELKIIRADWLSDPMIAANTEKRCYYCKRKMMTLIQNAAKADGYSIVLDGTNASDSDEDRPGMAALKALGVRSPLKECGMTKAMIREAARQAGLSVWNRPADACLATRIPCGTPLTADDLKRTEKAEAFLATLGFSDFRVRTRQGDAVIQIRGEQMPLFLKHQKTINETLKADYNAVFLDMENRS